MSVFVKLCGMTREADVDAAIAAGADALGFVFAESPRRVTAVRAAELAARMPEGILRVAVMQHPTAAEWREVLETFAPDVLQTDAEDFAGLDVPRSLRRWPVLREGIAAADTLPEGEFVYEGGRSGQGRSVDWNIASELARGGLPTRRMVLAGGLGPDNVAEAIAQVRPWGVDASSGLESAPGRKDPQRMAAFVRAAKSVNIGTGD